MKEFSVASELLYAKLNSK